MERENTVNNFQNNQNPHLKLNYRLMGMLRDDRIMQHSPTVHPHSEELYIHNRRFRAFDLGGHETARRIWKVEYGSNLTQKRTLGCLMNLMQHILM